MVPTHNPRLNRVGPVNKTLLLSSQFSLRASAHLSTSYFEEIFYAGLPQTSRATRSRVGGAGGLPTCDAITALLSFFISLLCTRDTSSINRRGVEGSYAYLHY